MRFVMQMQQMMMMLTDVKKRKVGWILLCRNKKKEKCGKQTSEKNEQFSFLKGAFPFLFFLSFLTPSCRHEVAGTGGKGQGRPSPFPPSWASSH